MFWVFSKLQGPNWFLSVFTPIYCMVRNLIVFLVLAGFVFSAPVPVGSCQDISVPGEYVLTQDLVGLNGTNTWCIRVSADNVTLDCDGHMISRGGSGSGIGFKADNITIQNCVITGYDYGINGVSYNNSKISNNTLHTNNYNNLYMDASYCEVSGNTIYGTPDGEDCAYIFGNGNLISGNEVYNGGYAGLVVNGGANTLEGNTAYNNAESGFKISGYENILEGNTAYGNDWKYLEGGGFEFGSAAGNLINGNTAYNNTNGFYISGVAPRPPSAPSIFGNIFTNNHAYDNLVGLNFLDWNGTYTDNTLEENLEMDLFVGGDMWFGSVRPASGLAADVTPDDMAIMCANTVEGNTGSGGRDIFYSSETVTLNGGTYSEVLLCNASDSVISGVTVSGSNALDNNGMLLILSNGATVSSSTSQNNFMGFGIFASPDVALSGSNADGSGFGIVSLMSENFEATSFTSRNNRMDATAILDFLGMFTGGGLLMGETETLRAPVPEIKEIGAGAVLVESPRATISSSTFSGSTFGLALLMSDEATISGGSAYNNDLFGYGMIESYAVTFDKSSAYSNDGNLHDIFEGDVPEAYVDLQYMPFGAGVFGLSFGALGDSAGIASAQSGGTLLAIEESCYAYADCDIAAGMLCNFTSHRCEPGTYENNFNGMRIYENNYGMVLLSRGHEVVDGCRIYDNSILGILDAAYFEREVFGTTVEPTPVTPPAKQAITVRNSYLYRNGETMFSTLSDTFEEGGRPQWAAGFELIDEMLPKGVIELEIIEATHIYRMGTLGALVEQPHWTLEETTIGTGTSSVRVSLDDNLDAVYLLSDTTLPSQDSIHIESGELEVNITMHIDIEDFSLGERIPYNEKYFVVGAVTEAAPLGADLSGGPAIDEFTVHYGPSTGYDGSTMALYQLRFEETGTYCEDDLDCSRDEFCWTEANICKLDAERECIDDANCTNPDFPYCNGFQCTMCQDDSDCTKPCTKCNSEGWCGRTYCFSDADCDGDAGCECIERDGIGYCGEPRLSGDGASASSALLGEPVVLRGTSVPEQEVIVRAYWEPVPYQVRNETTQEITVYNLTQKDRTAFISSLLEAAPLSAEINLSNMTVYAEVYGLFAMYEGVPGGGGGDEPEYVCELDVDCPACYYCSIGNNMCLPKTDVECGVPGTGCANGYECVECTCVPAEVPEEGCTSDRECAGNEYCADDGECVPVPCECGEVKGHECVPFECCSNDDCGEGEVCRDNKCIEVGQECPECEEPIRETEETLSRLGDDADTSVADELLEKAKNARDEGDCETAKRYAEAALAAATALMPSEVAPTVPIISTEVPSAEVPKMPNGKEVTEMQHNTFWLVLVLLGLALIGYWWFMTRVPPKKK
jgi:parallel beta-helix repeat protein